VNIIHGMHNGQQKSKKQRKEKGERRKVLGAQGDLLKLWVL